MKTDRETKVSFYCEYGMIVFTWNCIRAIGNPRYVQMVVSPKLRCMALMPGSADEEDVFAVPRGGRAHSAGFALEGRENLLYSANLMGWNDDGIYEIEGSLAAENVLLFALDAAEKFRGKLR